MTEAEGAREPSSRTTTPTSATWSSSSCRKRGMPCRPSPTASPPGRRSRPTQPDLVVLDVMMPGLSGFDVLRKIRDSDWPEVPVLLLSAKSRDSDVDTGFAVGATDYVIKPFSPRELLHRVNGILARAQ